MEFEKIRELIENLTAVMDAKKLDELEIETEGLKVALRRSRGGDAPAAYLSAPGTHPGAPAHDPRGAARHDGSEGIHVVRSPMVGTLYRAPAPDADSFVEVGDEVAPETVMCIIEAMKVMNELKAEMEGTVVSIEVDNGEAVEYGQTLFRIAPKKA